MNKKSIEIKEFIENQESDDLIITEDIENCVLNNVKEKNNKTSNTKDSKTEETQDQTRQ